MPKKARRAAKPKSSAKPEAVAPEPKASPDSGVYSLAALGFLLLTVLSLFANWGLGRYLNGPLVWVRPIALASPATFSATAFFLAARAKRLASLEEEHRVANTFRWMAGFGVVFGLYLGWLAVVLVRR